MIEQWPTRDKGDGYANTINIANDKESILTDVCHRRHYKEGIQVVSEIFDDFNTEYDESV